MALRAVMQPGSHAAALEICAQSHTDTDHRGQVFQLVLYLHGPRDDRASPGSPMGNLCGACYCAGKEKVSSNLSIAMVILLLIGITHVTKLAVRSKFEREQKTGETFPWSRTDLA